MARELFDKYKRLEEAERTRNQQIYLKRKLNARTG